jgi:two-component system phosphate regulon response regulator OmpR
MSHTIAVVEDEDALREAVAEYLDGRGMRVLSAASAGELRALAATEPIDVAVIDIAMPGESGLSLARWLKERGSKPGIIFATAAGRPRDRIAGIELGADDYIVKPYELRELYARINSVLRRLPAEPAKTVPGKDGPQPAGPENAYPGAVRIGSFVLDPVSGQLTQDGRELARLSPKEVELLLVLVKRPKRLLTRAQLIELARAHDDDVDLRSIDVRIARLRAKLESGSDRPTLIRTIRGEGYMFVPEGA